MSSLHSDAYTCVVVFLIILLVRSQSWLHNVILIVVVLLSAHALFM